MPASVVKQLTVDGQDDSGLVRNRNEFPRHDQTLGTLPATERLEPYDLAVVQGDDGLVVNAELVQLEGFAQVSFELQTFDGARMHSMVEHFTARFAGALGAIHGNLGVAEDVLCLGPGIAAESNPDAYRQHDLLTIQIEGNGQSLLNALGDANGVAGVMKFLEEHRELVASGPGQRTLVCEGLCGVTQAGT